MALFASHLCDSCTNPTTYLDRTSRSLINTRENGALGCSFHTKIFPFPQASRPPSSLPKLPPVKP
ncbi:hypothetical protein KFK09_028164 [Dendrobium nobile]|uniref:Uncharacterized protein n=1 Tax=Dendrobium nobile TaxID=94219 RepID=A0A8T3A0X1_DENNO|nr:hypothetical protein KFK09_028164 [Dendrobium nobile]